MERKEWEGAAGGKSALHRMVGRMGMGIGQEKNITHQGLKKRSAEIINRCPYQRTSMLSC